MEAGLSLSGVSNLLKSVIPLKSWAISIGLRGIVGVGVGVGSGVAVGAGEGVAVTTGIGVGGGWYFGGLQALRIKRSHGINRRIVKRTNNSPPANRASGLAAKQSASINRSEVRRNAMNESGRRKFAARTKGEFSFAALRKGLPSSMKTATKNLPA